MRFRNILGRSLRLRCPLCGKGRLFRGWFHMHSHCPECHVRFEREAGFYLGSIYFNYGLTALVVAVAYPLLRMNNVLPTHLLMGLTVAFAVLFPLWFFRYARALWLGFDQYWDPRRDESAASANGSAAPSDAQTAPSESAHSVSNTPDTESTHSESANSRTVDPAAARR